MPFEPMPGYLIVKELDQNKTESGLSLVDESKNLQYGTVVAMGGDTQRNGDPVSLPPTVQKDRIVIFAPYSVVSVKDHKTYEEFLFIKYEDIMGVRHAA